MIIVFDPDETTPKKWTASTDKGGYDGAGETPLDAISDLVTNMEFALGERRVP
jgi:hypothetical protein